MTTSVVVFTRDLRVHDNPVLASAASESDRVVPLFVHDVSIGHTAFAGQGKQRFLAECLADLDRQLRRLGGRLVLRHGDIVREVCEIAEEVNAARVHIAADASNYAVARETALRSALRQHRRELCCHPGVHTVVDPGTVTPKNKDHFAIFTPYYHAWCATRWRRPVTTPNRVTVPDVQPGHLPGVDGRATEWVGGETTGRLRAEQWLADGIQHYDQRRDDLFADGTSRLSPYLHFGCVSAVELARSAGQSAGAQAFVRQIAWRDFHYQVLAARPDAAHHDYRSRGNQWQDDPEALQAWREGCTGIPIVDAGMRQLRAEGWMHGRARLITASFLTKTLYLDWRAGADHFFRLLVDGDVASNSLNWQWVAGTGTDTRPNRVINPLRQALRHDPDGNYVRRYVAELSGVDGPDIHQPWQDPASRRHGYPPPIIDLDVARSRFLTARGR